MPICPWHADPSHDELLADADRDVMEGWNAEDSQPLQEWLDGLRREVRERVAELRELDGVDVVEGFYASSVREFRMQAEAIGALEGPDWLVEVLIRATARELRTRILLYDARHDASGVLDLVAADTLVVMPPEDILMAAPEAIAAAARYMARRVLAPS